MSGNLNQKSNHVTPEGNVHMVSISNKKETQRTAKAEGLVRFPENVEAEGTKEWHTPKGPVFQTAVIAGIQGAKECSRTIPLCHPLLLTGIDVELEWVRKDTLKVTGKVSCTGKTGVEMEALCAVSAACLTVYDMGKSVYQGIRIEQIHLMEKRGGKTDYASSH